MLPEDRPDKRATHAIVVERVDGLTLRNIDIDWDDRSPEPAWGSALVLRGVSRLILREFHGARVTAIPGPRPSSECA